MLNERTREIPLDQKPIQAEIDDVLRVLTLAPELQNVVRRMVRDANGLAASNVRLEQESTDLRILLNDANTALDIASEANDLLTAKGRIAELGDEIELLRKVFRRYADGEIRVEYGRHDITQKAAYWGYDVRFWNGVRIPKNAVGPFATCLDAALAVIAKDMDEKDGERDA